MQHNQHECRKYGIAVEPKYVSAEKLLQPSTLNGADLIHESATIDEQLELSLLHLFLLLNAPVYHHIQEGIQIRIDGRIRKFLMVDNAGVQ